MSRNSEEKELRVAAHNQDPYAVNTNDVDPQETAEWRESLDALTAVHGPARAREIMMSLNQRARELHLNVPSVPTTDYINTISAAEEPEFPGDELLEREYRSWMRWNAAMLVHRAQRPGVGVARPPVRRGSGFCARARITRSLLPGVP